jgi:hypothetical protein
VQLLHVALQSIAELLTVQVAVQEALSAWRTHVVRQVGEGQEGLGCGQVDGEGRAPARWLLWLPGHAVAVAVLLVVGVGLV